MADLRQRFGRRLRSLREAQGLSQEVLAAGASVSRVYLGALERGDKVPRIDIVERLARALGVTLSKLLDFDASLPRRESAPHEQLGKRVSALARRASERELERFEEIARAFFRR